jgi:hypothetical protein
LKNQLFNVKNRENVIWITQMYSNIKIQTRHFSPEIIREKRIVFEKGKALVNP